MSSAKAVLGALLLIAALPLAACAPTPQPQSTTAASGFSEEIRTNFLTSCEAQAGATSERCECSLDALEKSFTEKEFIKLELALAAGSGSSDEDLDKVAEAMASCLA